MDKVSRDVRSRMMRAVKSKNTKPEIAVRRTLHAAGYRFRLHRSDLPGTPDLVLPRFKIAIFVHGCFWHGHSGCARAALPASNSDFWLKKLARNRARDDEVQRQLQASGWRPVTIWQCQIGDPNRLALQLQRMLPPPTLAGSRLKPKKGRPPQL